MPAPLFYALAFIICVLVGVDWLGGLVVLLAIVHLISYLNEQRLPSNRRQPFNPYDDSLSPDQDDI